MLIRNFLLVIAVVIGLSCLAQKTQVRGPIPVATQFNSQYDTTYALIVGISKYQNFPSLQFADADAQAFNTFLRSPAGGNVDSANIKLLLNEKAKAQNIMSAIAWLSKKASAHTRIFIYFACHGDSYDEQEAFLLAYDAPPGGDDNMYITGGTIQVFNLKNRVKYMTSKNAEVVLITDACRTNDLPGKVNGVRYTNAKIMEQNAGEIQFSSCSANQTSMEGAGWGGGRGLFSWHLINGMYGLADKDNDGNVSWFELKNYVTDSVRANSKGPSGSIRQTPTFFCEDSKIDLVAEHVDEKVKARIIASLRPTVKPKPMARANQTVMRALIHFEDFSVQTDYENFQKALSQQNFTEKSSGAYTQLNKLLGSKNVSEERKSDLKDMYIDEVLNYCQTLVNDYLGGERSILSQPSIQNATEGMKSIMGMVSLEGNERNNFMGKYFFFMAREKIFSEDPIDLKLGVSFCDSAIKYQPNAAYIFNTRGLLHGSLGQLDLALSDINRALSLAPNWVFPMVGMAIIEARYFNDYNASINWCKKALAIDSTFTAACDMMAMSDRRMYAAFGGNYDQLALSNMKKSISVAPDFSGPYRSIANYYYSYYQRDSVLYYLNIAFRKDTTNWESTQMLGDFYSTTDPVISQKYYEKSLVLGGDSAEIYSSIGSLLEQQGNDSVAYEYYKKAFRINNWNESTLNHLTDYWQKYEANEAALNLINKLIQVDSANDYFYRSKAGVEMRRGEIQAAGNDYQHAYAIAPYKAINTISLIRFYAKTNPSDPRYLFYLAKGDSMVPKSEEMCRRNIEHQLIQSNLDSAYQLISVYNEQIEHYNSLKYFAAQICSMKQKYGEAISWYEKAGKLEPNSEYRIYIANTYLEDGNSKMAIQTAREEVSVQPKNAEGRLLLGNLFLQMGFVDSAILVLENTKPTLEREYQKNFLLGRAYQMKGNSKQAIHYYEESIAQKPNYATPYLCLAQLYQKKRFKKGKAKQYLSFYDQLVAEQNKQRQK